MPSKEYFIEQIERELSISRNALKAGREAIARVSARRAAGRAIAWLLTVHPRPGWGADAISQLVHLRDDVSFPPLVREAARRLSTKISDRFVYPFTTNPIEDAQIVIDHVAGTMNEDPG